MPETFQAFAEAVTTAQRSYITGERDRYRKALETPGDKEALALLQLHPLTRQEIEARLSQLDEMDSKVEETHGAQSPGTRAAWFMSRKTQDKPLAVAPLTSYRCKGRFDWIMIGATDPADAMREARRSAGEDADPATLEVWNVESLCYVPAAVYILRNRDYAPDMPLGQCEFLELDEHGQTVRTFQALPKDAHAHAVEKGLTAISPARLFALRHDGK